MRTLPRAESLLWGAALSLLLACTDKEPADDSRPHSGDDSSGHSGDDSAPHTGDDSGTPATRPNLLLLIADDMGLDKASFDPVTPCYVIGALSEDPPMPTLSRLCQEGVRFEYAWGYPTCSPFRATVLSGLYPFHHGMGTPVYLDSRLPEDTQTLPRLMADSGYAMANFGKWHLSGGDQDPNLMGWPHYAGSPTGQLEDYSDWERVENGLRAQVTDYATTRTVDDAITWLDTLEGDPPWLMWIGFNAPHSPFHVPPVELHSYDALPEPEPDDDDRPYYAAMLEAMDTEIGRLLSHLEAQGELEDTVVIFMGDNGSPPSVVNAPFDELTTKGTLEEGGIRVPMLAWGYGVSGGRSVAEPVNAVDIFPTFLDAARVDRSAIPTDGLSLWPLLDGSAEALEREVIVSEQFDGPPNLLEYAGKTVRDRRYKLRCYDELGNSLYDLANDPFEGQDLLVGEVSEETWEIAHGLEAQLEAMVGEDVCRWEE